MPIGCTSLAALPCFSVEQPGYASVPASMDTGTIVGLSQVSGDRWTGTVVGSAGLSLNLDTACNRDIAGAQDLRVQLPDGTWRAAVPLSVDSVTKKYEYHVIYPETSGPILHKVYLTPTLPSPSFSLRQWAHVRQEQHATLTATFSLPVLAGNRIVAFFIQYGSTASGGVLQPVGPPSGFTTRFSDTNKQAFIYDGSLAAGSSAVTISPGAAGDMQLFAIAEIDLAGGTPTQGTFTQIGNAGSASMSSTVPYPAAAHVLQVGGWFLYNSAHTITAAPTITPTNPPGPAPVSDGDKVVTGGIPANEAFGVSFNSIAISAGVAGNEIWAAGTNLTFPYDFLLYTLHS